MAAIRHLLSILLSSIMMAAVGCVLAACHHKDLNDDAGQSSFPLVKVEYDWDTTETDLPDGMANLFYSTQNISESYWRSDFRPSGGTFRIPAGTYDAVTFNNDTRDIVFSDIESLDDFTFSTSELNTSGIPDEYLPFPPQRLYSQPDRMWAATRNDLNVAFDAESLTFRFAPHRITREYQVEMYGITNLESALQYYAALSDLAPAIKASSLSAAGDGVTVGGFMQPFDNSTISCTVNNFGPSPTSSQQRLAVYMWLADGSRIAYIYDITEQIRLAPDSMNVVIRVTGPDLPEITPGEEGAGGGGLDVGVDDWDFVDIELRTH